MRIESLIIFENDDFVAVSKPSGLLTIPDRHDNELESLSGLLKRNTATSSPFTAWTAIPAAW